MRKCYKHDVTYAHKTPLTLCAQIKYEMQRDFIGRKKEIRILNNLYEDKDSKILTLYGRRRIGKSKLIKYFISDKSHLAFEGLEKESTPKQLEHFFYTLKKQKDDPLLHNIFKTWHHALDFITERSLQKKEEKQIFFLDELQWMAVGRSNLISLIKYYWDNYWSHSNILLILCGSISSFMINKVIRSKALYGRISKEVCLQELAPFESEKLLKGKFTKQEILQVLMCFGGVPKYLEEIQTNLSFQQNIISQCFQTEGFFFDEFKKIFYSQFKEHLIYERIVKTLSVHSMEYARISHKAKVASGGGLTRYLKNLEQAQFIKEITPFGASINSKKRRYKLTDPFINFHLKFIAPNIRTIRAGNGKQLYNKIQAENFPVYLGFAFEKFCVKNSKLLANLMGFNDYFLYAAPFFTKGQNSVQIDLLFERSDNIIVLAEIKYSAQKITTKVIPEVQSKLELLSDISSKRIQKSLISLNGPNQALKDSEYFDYYITCNDFFQEFEL